MYFDGVKKMQFVIRTVTCIFEVIQNLYRSVRVHLSRIHYTANDKLCLTTSFKTMQLKLILSSHITHLVWRFSICIRVFFFNLIHLLPFRLRENIRYTTRSMPPLTTCWPASPWPTPCPWRSWRSCSTNWFLRSSSPIQGRGEV